MASISVSAKISGSVSSARFAASTSITMSNPIYSIGVQPVNDIVKATITGLANNTNYFIQAELDGVLKGSIGTAKTPPSIFGNFSFAFGSAARSNSNHPIFDAIRIKDPDFFLHLGSWHYDGIDSNSVTLFRDSYDRIFNLTRQSQLYRDIPTYYMFDDWDYGVNDSDSTSATRPAAIQVFRERIPFSNQLLDTSTATSPVYYKFNYGRCVFLVTDCRSQKSPKANTDNSSKTVLGTAQKTWLINQFNNNPGKLIFWVNPLGWMGATTAGADSWQGYNTERVEIANAIKSAGITNRLIMLMGDMNAFAYDNGTNSDFATGGGAGIKVVSAAPLDQFNASSGTWSSGIFAAFEQQFGLVTVTDTNSNSISVNIKGFRYDSTQTTTLTTQIFDTTVTVNLLNETFNNTYYVSTTGSDSTGTGAIGSPWRTITKACTVAQAGDGILLRGGIYNLTSPAQITSNSGTSIAPITVKSYPGESAILDGSGIADNTDLMVIARQWFVIKDLEIRNSKKHGVSVWGSKNIVLKNLTIHGSQQNAIYLSHSTAWTVENIRVEECEVYNNVLVNQSLQGGITYDGGWPATVGATVAKNIHFINNNVHNNFGEGLNFNAVQGGTIIGNTCYDNFSVEIYLDQVTDVTVARNFCYTLNNPSHYRDGKSASKIQLGRELTNNDLNRIKIVSNIFVGGLACLKYSTYGAGGGLKNVLFANNTCYSSSGQSNYLINIDNDAGHLGTRIVNNIFHYGGGGIGIVRLPTTSGITYNDNCWFGGSPGVGSGTGDITVNPLMINPGTTNSNDYKLQASSPAKGIGETINDSLVNYDGVNRSIPYDLGAF